MKKFQFKLNPLLNYRKYLERLAQQDTAKAHLDVKNCEALIQALKQDRIQQADTIEKILQKGTSATQFKLFHDYLDAVENQIEDENGRKKQLKDVLKKKVEILKKKTVDKKVMETYRERQQIKYNDQLRQTEQKELDEISSLKTARKTSHETS